MDALIVVMRLVAGVVVLDTLVQFVRSDSPPGRFLRRLTLPLYRPVHAVVDPERAGADFAPMVVIMVLILAAQAMAPGHLD
ncbi:MAG: YggT family protein [Myxococcota bacterium]